MYRGDRLGSCDRCSEKAICSRRYSGQNFCKEHFIEYFENKVQKTLIKYQMIERNTKIAVGLSGGKDSITCTFILKGLEEKLGIQVSAILIDEGISGYRGRTIDTARKFCDEHKIPLMVLSFQDEIGHTLDSMVKKGEKNGCTYCGVFRRKLLNEAARGIGAVKLATGHNLDDEVQAIMMNYIRGDLDRLIRLSTTSKHRGFVPRIKPLMEMPEKEVALYTILKGFDISMDECPYARDSFRTGIRDFINNLEDQNPGIKFSILRGYQKIFPLIEKYELPPVGLCNKCGEPTSGDICKTCSLKKEIGD